jgi:hypothetical protein
MKQITALVLLGLGVFLFDLTGLITLNVMANNVIIIGSLAYTFGLCGTGFIVPPKRNEQQKQKIEGPEKPLNP